MIKPVRQGDQSVEASFWILNYSKIFFLCNQLFYSLNNSIKTPFYYGFYSRTYPKVFFFKKRVKIIGKPESGGFCRKIFFSISLTIYSFFLQKSFEISRKRVQGNKIRIGRDFYLNFEKISQTFKSLRFLLSYLNRFYLKKNKHISLIDFFSLFIGKFFLFYIIPNYSSFFLVVCASNLYFDGNLHDNHRKFFLLEKLFSYENSLIFRKTLKEEVLSFFRILDISSTFQRGLTDSKKIVRKMESILILELTSLKYFFLKNSTNFRDYLNQRKNSSQSTYWGNFILQLFKKSFIDFDEKPFLGFLKFFLEETGSRGFFPFFFLIILKLKIKEKTRNSLTDFPFTFNLFRYLDFKSTLFSFPESYLPCRINLLGPFHKLRFLQNLNCLDFGLVKFRVLCFLGTNFLGFLSEKKFQRKFLKNYMLETYFFIKREIGFYSFVFFIFFCLASEGSVELIKKAKLDNKLSKYIFSLEDRILEGNFKLNARTFLTNKTIVLNEIFTTLFEEKTFSDLNFSYFETRLRIISGDNLEKKFLITPKYKKKKEIGIQPVLQNFSLHNQLEISRRFNFKFFQNLKSWSILIKNSKETEINEYSSDLITTKTVFFSVNLTGNKNSLKTERAAKFLPVSIFRCFRFFSRFFFLEMMKEKHLIWNYLKSRVLVETSGYLCKKKIGFFIQVDLVQLFFLLSLNRLQIAPTEDLKSFFDGNEVEINHQSKNLEKIGLIKTKLNLKFRKRFFILEKHFFPYNKITKIPSSSEWNSPTEEVFLSSYHLSDHIYISEAIIVRILKSKISAKGESILKEARKKLKDIFCPDIRGLILQAKILVEKGYIDYVKKEKSFYYSLD